MSEPLPARIAEAKAKRIPLPDAETCDRMIDAALEVIENQSQYERSDVLSAKRQFVAWSTYGAFADQLASAHAEAERLRDNASKMRTVIEAAREASIHRPRGDWDKGCTGNDDRCEGCALRDALADFDRGEQG